MSTRWLLTALAVLVVVGGAVALIASPAGTQQGTGTACTAEAMQCPDGSYVGRTGPNCEFAACPDTGTPASGTLGAHCGGFIQNAPTCNAGLHCKLNTSTPDTGGVCVVDQAGSGVQGTVTLGPTCPVERVPPDPQCADKPYATRISVARAADPTLTVATTESDAQGTFQLTLTPGEYIVSAAGGNTLPRCSPVDATVSAGTFTPLSISCDTGIR